MWLTLWEPVEKIPHHGKKSHLDTVGVHPPAYQGEGREANMTLAVQSCSQLSISLAFHPHLEKKNRNEIPWRIPRKLCLMVFDCLHLFLRLNYNAWTQHFTCNIHFAEIKMHHQNMIVKKRPINVKKKKVNIIFFVCKFLFFYVYFAYLHPQGCLSHTDTPCLSRWECCSWCEGKKNRQHHFCSELTQVKQTAWKTLQCLCNFPKCSVITRNKNSSDIKGKGSD